jgi:hypothetical protein
VPKTAKSGIQGYLVDGAHELETKYVCSLSRRSPAREGVEGCMLYAIANGLTELVEASGELSVEAAQAGLLVALYELGHGIEPATYIFVRSQAASTRSYSGNADAVRSNSLGRL